MYNVLVILELLSLLCVGANARVEGSSFLTHTCYNQIIVTWMESCLLCTFYCFYKQCSFHYQLICFHFYFEFCFKEWTCLFLSLWLVMLVSWLLWKIYARYFILCCFIKAVKVKYILIKEQNFLWNLFFMQLYAYFVNEREPVGSIAINVYTFSTLLVWSTDLEGLILF